MTTKSFEYGQVFAVGDVVKGSVSTWARKIVARVHIAEIGEYRYVLQLGAVLNNEFKADGKGDTLSLYSVKEIKDNYTSLWTPDEIEFKKGDVYKDSADDYYVVQNSDGKAWHLRRGQWSTIKVIDGVVKWDGKTLTEVKTVIGEKFSKQLG